MIAIVGKILHEGVSATGELLLLRGELYCPNPLCVKRLQLLIRSVDFVQVATAKNGLFLEGFSYT